MTTIEEVLVSFRGDIRDLSAKVETIERSMGNMEKATEKSNSSLSRMRDIAGGIITARVIDRIADGLGNIARQSIGVASRAQEMNIVLDNLARQNGHRVEEIQKYVSAVKDLGITTSVAQSVISQGVRIGLDLESLPKLARAAQDFAVLSGSDSSTTLNRILYGITTRQSEVLRTAGVMVTPENAMKAYAEQVGKTTKQLTEQEKTQALVNAVLDQATTLTGTYESSMESAGKRQRSLTRHVEETYLAIGNYLLPSYGTWVDLQEVIIKGIRGSVEEGGALVPLLERIGKASNSFIEFLIEVAQSDPAARFGSSLLDFLEDFMTLAEQVGPVLRDMTFAGLELGVSIISPVVDILGDLASIVSENEFVINSLVTLLVSTRFARAAGNLAGILGGEGAGLSRGTKSAIALGLLPGITDIIGTTQLRNDYEQRSAAGMTIGRSAATNARDNLEGGVFNTDFARTSVTSLVGEIFNQFPEQQRQLLSSGISSSVLIDSILSGTIASGYDWSPGTSFGLGMFGYDPRWGSNDAGSIGLVSSGRGYTANLDGKDSAAFIKALQLGIEAISTVKEDSSLELQLQAREARDQMFMDQFMAAQSNDPFVDIAPSQIDSLINYLESSGQIAEDPNRTPTVYDYAPYIAKQMVGRGQELVSQRDALIGTEESPGAMFEQYTALAKSYSDSLALAPEETIYGKLLGLEVFTAESISDVFNTGIVTGEKFSNDMLTAIEKGLNPQIVTNLIAAGPEEAGKLLEAVANDSTGAMIEALNKGQEALIEFQTQQLIITDVLSLAITTQAGNMENALLAIEARQILFRDGWDLTAQEIADKLDIPVGKLAQLAPLMGDLSDEWLLVVSTIANNPIEFDWSMPRGYPDFGNWGDGSGGGGGGYTGGDSDAPSRNNVPFAPINVYALDPESAANAIAWELDNSGSR